jgi:monoterpene epsilon-lactone hydrolase
MSAIPDKQIYVPPTISAEAQELLGELIEAKLYATEFPAPDDLSGWNKVYDVTEERSKEMAKKSLAASQATATEVQLGGVTVEDIRPHGWIDNGKVLVYIHGGGYCLFSARSTFPLAAPMAKATGLRVVSVNYTPAPRAQFAEIQEQIVSVIDALTESGYAMPDIAVLASRPVER